MNKQRTGIQNSEFRIQKWLALSPFHLVTLSLLLSGCAALDLGPEPSSVITPTQAVTPDTQPSYDLNIPGATTTPATQPAITPLTLSLQDAILATLKNNPSLKVQRYNVPIARTAEEGQRAAFDPVLTGQISGGRTNTPLSRSNPSAGNTNNDAINSELNVQQFFPTGTTVALDGTTQYSASSFYSGDTVVTRGGLTVTQSLLRGGDMDANLALLREAQIDTRSSQYELRAFAEALISTLEQAYWDYALAQRQMDIVQDALDVALAQLRDTNSRIDVGSVAPTERAAAEAEVALRRELLINARGNLDQARLRLVQLIAAPKTADWSRPVQLANQPFTPPAQSDNVEDHIQIALAQRPEINQAKLQIKRGDLEVVRTKNGLLPKLDLFVTLGKSGYAESFGGSLTNLNGPSYDAMAGVSVQYPLLNRAAKADARRATLSREQADEALSNLTQTVQVDVRSAYIDVTRSREQIAATAASRIAQETTATVEQEKFRVGKSTSLLVAQAQRDLLTAQIAEVQAVVNHLKALTALYRLEGSLLTRRFISAPAPKF